MAGWTACGSRPAIVCKYSTTRERAQYMSVPSSKTTKTYESLNIVWARTALTCGAASRAVTIGYVTWSSMMLGGDPSQLVWMMTCTSEISGRASSGMWPIDQMPAITNSKTPVNTRNRLRAHHSMVRLITLHSSRRIECEVLAHDDLSVLSGRDGHLPRATGAQVTVAFIQTATFVTRMDNGFHGGHSHVCHGGHKECNRDLSASNWFPVAR